MTKTLTKILLIVLLILGVSPSLALAEKGDFYEEHKQFYGDNIPESYKDILQNYNKETQTIECGRFEVTCYIYKFMFDTGVSAMEFIKDIMKTTVLSPTDVLQNPTYERYQDGLFALSKTVLAIFIAFNMTKIVSLRMAESDDGAVVMNEKIMSIFVIGVFLFLYESIIHWILNFQELLMKEIIESIPTDELVINIITNILLSPGLFAFLTVLVIGIILVVLTLQFYYRIALVAILYIAGPIAIATKINDTYNFFDFWLKQFITAFLTLALQLISTAIGLQQFFKTPEYFGDTTNLFTGTAFFILAITLPSILGQWGFSTGSSRTLASGAKTFTRVALRR